MIDIDALSLERIDDANRILVTGDTHFRAGHTRLPDQILAEASTTDLIVHLGDFCTFETFEMFDQLGKVIAVRGNNDDARLIRSLPLARLLEVNGFRIAIMHGHGVGRLSARNAVEKTFRENFDMVLFGHSHRSLIESVGSAVYVNPGSPTDKRWEKQYSFATLESGVTLIPRLHYYERPDYS